MKKRGELSPHDSGVRGSAGERRLAEEPLDGLVGLASQQVEEREFERTEGGWCPIDQLAVVAPPGDETVETASGGGRRGGRRVLGKPPTRGVDRFSRHVRPRAALADADDSVVLSDADHILRCSPGRARVTHGDA